MIKKTQRRSVETQDRILNVTRNLFNKQGQANVTTDQIAQSANVAKGTIFAHFTDRANLVAAVGVGELDKIVGTIRTTRTDGPAVDQFMAAYGRLLTFFAEKPEFAELYVYQSLYSQGKWSSLFTNKCLDFEAILQDIITQSTAHTNPSFLVGGAQAFFLQVTTYHQAGWLDYDAAIARLRAYLIHWLK